MSFESWINWVPIPLLITLVVAALLTGTSASIVVAAMAFSGVPVALFNIFLMPRMIADVEATVE